MDKQQAENTTKSTVRLNKHEMKTVVLLSDKKKKYASPSLVNSGAKSSDQHK